MEKKILVVDDEENIRDILNEAFTISGFKVRTASTAEEALDIVKREEFFVYFLDIKLPGMSGIRLFRGLKRAGMQGYFFAITGNPSYLDAKNSIEIGFDYCFAKPFKLEELIKTANWAFANLDKRVRNFTNNNLIK